MFWAFLNYCFLILQTWMCGSLESPLNSPERSLLRKPLTHSGVSRSCQVPMSNQTLTSTPLSDAKQTPPTTRPAPAKWALPPTPWPSSPRHKRLGPGAAACHRRLHYAQHRQREPERAERHDRREGRWHHQRAPCSRRLWGSRLQTSNTRHSAINHSNLSHTSPWWQLNESATASHCGP